MGSWMKIGLTQGKSTIVDASDFVILSQWKWHLSHFGYAERRQHLPSSRKNQKFRMIRMHRLVMEIPDNMQIDHANGDRLDNRRSNLRICTGRQNSYNQRKRSDNTSGYKGVTWNTAAGKWEARVGHKYLGLFEDKKQAALAYNLGASEMYGEFARPNEL